MPVAVAALKNEMMRLPRQRIKIALRLWMPVLMLRIVVALREDASWAQGPQHPLLWPPGTHSPSPASMILLLRLGAEAEAGVLRLVLEAGDLRLRLKLGVEAGG